MSTAIVILTDSWSDNGAYELMRYGSHMGGRCALRDVAGRAYRRQAQGSSNT